MNDEIIKYLKSKGYNPSQSYYSKIENWISLWKGKTAFHKYEVVYNQQRYEEEMYSLGMPARISNDWASICWTEKDTIKTSEKNQEYLDQKLLELRLNKLLPGAIEKSAYSGTCGALIRIKNAKLKDNTLTVDNFTKYDLIFTRANQIIPLRVEHGKIIDCAFISEEQVGDKKIYYIEIHELVKKPDEKGEYYESYKITNTYIDEDGKEIEKKGVLKSFYTNSTIPLFSILEPPIENPYCEANGLGYSIYGGAIDQIYAVDIAYNNFVMDYYLGGKKVFYNKNLCEKDDNGNPVYPTDVQKQQFQMVGDELDVSNEKALMHEYNPDLRIDDNTKGLQFALDLLSFKCGLGNKYYEFNSSGNIVTATQYVGDRQDLTVNARKYRENVDEFIENICRGILLLGRILFKKDVDENDKIEVVNSDGFLISEEDLKKQYIEEIAAGLRQPWEYRVKFLGEDETTAKKMINNEPLDENDLGE